ncbi:AAA family ATPase [Shewanella submarina]|uniref:AAA family ATPase n=1 Tax=Shewanella submarina TaxID=2016376 RepID=A0ABV7G7Z6_9GAMM|nr:AAA family ATPase [Shewanella submarina]MCL1036974.1 AAA family ATPase [Shewanella submarina]
MYKAFFGLNDNPFSIAPNPHYLFLSDRHREALAHLTYGLGETGGFVLLTGEVGTGKTTVSRCLLQQLPDNTDTAFILNPSLTEQELLATLCDELKISYGDNPSLKQLTDLLSQYLLKNHEAGRNTVLIIDEAQHLRPEVLEQLRLLTNLETDTKKLLQVILIGQPELQQLLKRQELRQLAQRITARYHLLPLSEQELGLYVQHRLQVAGRHEPLFTAKAIKVLHKATGGIPRLSNLICERALMAAYAQSKVPVDHKMVQTAAAEVLGEEPDTARNWWPMVAGVGFVLAFGAVFYTLQSGDKPAEQQAAELANVQPVVTEPVLTEPAHTDLAGNGNAHSNNLGQRQLQRALEQSGNIDTAFAALLGLWNRTPYQDMSPCQAATLQGLACFQQQGNSASILRLNYPAVVYLHSGSTEAFGTLISREGEELLLQLGEQQFWVSRDWFERHFSGVFEILWQPDQDASQPIGPHSSQPQLQWLENSLAMVDKVPARLVNGYDSQLEQRLKTFQRQHGLQADGIAGSQTLTQLGLYLSQSGPRLSSGEQF